MRECYTTALNAGALPSGAPNYRNDDCSCFNAAVEDLDGNTIEFIFRQPHGEGGCCETIAPSQGSKVLTWQKDVASSATQDDARSVAQTMVSQGSLASKTSKKSRMQTALDLASTNSKNTKSEAPSQGISRSSTAPAKSDFPGKALIGTALGAAAGAALMYAMTKAESTNAKEEADHLAYMSSKSRSRASVDEHRPPPPRAETVPPSTKALSQAPPLPPKTVYSQPPPAPSSHKSEIRRFHRNFSTTESAFSRPPRAQTNAMRMIEATGYNDANESVQEFMRSHNNLRAQPTRSRTYNEEDFATAAPSGHSMKRASTLPIEMIDNDRPNYYLEAPPAKSSYSRHSSRHSEAARSQHYAHSTASSSRHRRDDDADLKRHDSGVSMHNSSHSHRRDTHTSDRRSSASTIKPSRRRDSAYENAAAAAAMEAKGRDSASRAPSSCYFPAAISLPPSSRAGSEPITVIQENAPPPALEPVASKQSWEDFSADDEDDDGLQDSKTVLPEDSISCVDLSKSNHRRHRRHHRRDEDEEERGSRHSRSSRHSDATVKPIRKEKEKGSVLGMNLPHRSGKRSLLGF